MRQLILPLVAVMIIAAACPAPADWNPEDPAKYVQFPDLATTGIDVNATAPYILADDFLCEETGSITDIHVWGSWKNDYVPLGSPGEVSFRLYILSDIPASQSPTGYSMPGEILWERIFAPNQYSVRIYADGLEEGWLDPPEGYLFPGDHICYQYNFSLDEQEYFYQEGSPAQPIIYWLEVQAFPADPGASFGWKTSLDHWNDDATYASGNEPAITDRFELIYPPGHPMAGQSIDLAFALQGLGGAEEYDFGDAPDPTYPTLLINDGARHAISAGRMLGRNIDAEPDGQPHPNASGDDISGSPDDEDGVFFMEPFSSNEPSDMKILTSSPGVLDVWFDWGGDGSWAESGDYVFGGVPVFAPGYTDFTVTPPADVTAGTVSCARVRFSSTGTPSFLGSAPDGEVEDYEFVISEEYPFKWSAYPDITDLGLDVNCSFPYLLADDFECDATGRITEIHIWGSWLNDYLPYGDDPQAVNFVLSLHADIPADTLTGAHSRPGEILWIYPFGPGEFVSQVWRDGIEEGWLDPPDASLFPGDHVCWHYAFFIDPEEAFLQQGSEEEPLVYWLDVQAMPLDEGARFGWKTAYEHWNDDAVWGEGIEPYMAPWSELVYPYGPYAGESIDLSFAIYSEDDSDVEGPTEPRGYGLRQNIPNPFNPSTVIVYEVPAGGGSVTIDVVDVTGRVVTTLVDERTAPGVNSVIWDGTDEAGHRVSSGVYFCRMSAGGATRTRKMVLLK